MVNSTRTGRRPGPGAARNEILEVARGIFAREGFRGTTIRAVAAAASVDPALITHYFGSKQGLFDAAIDLPFDPRETFPRLVTEPYSEIGERIARFFLATWSADRGHALPTLMRTVVSEPAAVKTLQHMLVRDGLAPALAAAGFDEPELRATLAASQLVGAGVLRFILQMEPIASEPEERLVAILAPVLQRYLTEPLPGAPAGKEENHARTSTGDFGS